MERNTQAYYELLNATVELFNERIQEGKLTEGSDYHDALAEVVDGQVPHHHREILEVIAADGLDLEFEDSGFIPETKDVMRILQARIYEQLLNDVPQQMDIAWWEQPEDDEEEDAE